MKVIAKYTNKIVLRFEIGDELIENLKSFCKNEGITSAFFYGIGAAQSATISSYHLSGQKYDSEELGEYEIAPIVGNVTLSEDQIFIHAHVNLGFKDKPNKAGHVKKLIVAATCEILLEVLPMQITRIHSDEVGLNLMEPTGIND